MFRPLRQKCARLCPMALASSTMSSSSLGPADLMPWRGGDGIAPPGAIAILQRRIICANKQRIRLGHGDPEVALTKASDERDRAGRSSGARIVELQPEVVDLSDRINERFTVAASGDFPQRCATTSSQGTEAVAAPPVRRPPSVHRKNDR